MKVCLINSLNPELEGVVIDSVNVDYLVGGRNPLGLAYLAAVLIDGGHEVIIVDRVVDHFRFGFAREAVDRRTIEQMTGFDPDVIGISCMTGNYSDAVHISKVIKSERQFKDRPLIMGGYHPTVEAESVLNECQSVDLVIRGEAEYAFLDYVNGEPEDSISGIVLRRPGENTKYYSSPLLRQPKQLDGLPYPARHLLDMDFYTQPNSAAVPGMHVESTTFISTRGCPSRCFFCGQDRLSPNVRLQSAESVVAEIEEVIANYTVNCIVFADQLFVMNIKRATKFCELMIEKGLNKKVIWTANARPDSVKSDVLELMHEAGCAWLCYGFESGSQRMLDTSNKCNQVETNVAAAKMTRSAGILFNASMIAGLPDETEEDFLDSRKFVDEIQPDSVGFNLFTALPGSEYYDRLVLEGRLKKEGIDWREIGQLNVEKSNTFCDMPYDRFMSLYQEASTDSSRISNQKYYEKNYLKNPQGAKNRLAYNQVEAKIEEEPCYKILSEAKDLDVLDVNQPNKYREAIEARPCLMPCPCPTGCSFYSQYAQGLGESLLAQDKQSDLQTLCEEVVGIPRVTFDTTSFRSYLDHLNDGRQITSEDGAFFNAQDNYIQIPSLAEWSAVPDQSTRMIAKKELLYIHSSPSKFKYLTTSPAFSIKPGAYSLRYLIDIIEGGVTIGLISKNGNRWVANNNVLESGFGECQFDVNKPMGEVRMVIAACNFDSERISEFRLFFTSLCDVRQEDGGTREMGARYG